MWHRIAAVAECPAGACLELVAGDRIIALFNVAGEFHALDGVCPHQGGPLGKGRLGNGPLDGCIVTCPWHGWQFDVRDGQHQLSATIRQERFATRVDGSEVFVELPQ